MVVLVRVQGVIQYSDNHDSDNYDGSIIDERWAGDIGDIREPRDVRDYRRIGRANGQLTKSDTT